MCITCFIEKLHLREEIEYGDGWKHYLLGNMAHADSN